MQNLIKIGASQQVFKYSESNIIYKLRDPQYTNIQESYSFQNSQSMSFTITSELDASVGALRSRVFVQSLYFSILDALNLTNIEFVIRKQQMVPVYEFFFENITQLNIANCVFSEEEPDAARPIYFILTNVRALNITGSVFSRNVVFDLRESALRSVHLEGNNFTLHTDADVPPAEVPLTRLFLFAQRTFVADGGLFRLARNVFRSQVVLRLALAFDAPPPGGNASARVALPRVLLEENEFAFCRVLQFQTQNLVALAFAGGLELARNELTDSTVISFAPGSAVAELAFASIDVDGDVFVASQLLVADNLQNLSLVRVALNGTRAHACQLFQVSGSNAQLAQVRLTDAVFAEEAAFYRGARDRGFAVSGLVLSGCVFEGGSQCLSVELNATSATQIWEGIEVRDTNLTDSQLFRLARQNQQLALLLLNVSVLGGHLRGAQVLQLLANRELQLVNFSADGVTLEDSTLVLQQQVSAREQMRLQNLSLLVSQMRVANCRLRGAAVLKTSDNLPTIARDVELRANVFESNAEQISSQTTNGVIEVNHLTLERCRVHENHFVHHILLTHGLYSSVKELFLRVEDLEVLRNNFSLPQSYLLVQYKSFQIVDGAKLTQSLLIRDARLRDNRIPALGAPQEATQEYYFFGFERVQYVTLQDLTLAENGQLNIVYAFAVRALALERVGFRESSLLSYPVIQLKECVNVSLSALTVESVRVQRVSIVSISITKDLLGLRLPSVRLEASRFANNTLHFDKLSSQNALVEFSAQIGALFTLADTDFVGNEVRSDSDVAVTQFAQALAFRAVQSELRVLGCTFKQNWCQSRCFTLMVQSKRLFVNDTQFEGRLARVSRAASLEQQEGGFLHAQSQDIELVDSRFAHLFSLISVVQIQSQFSFNVSVQRNRFEDLQIFSMGGVFYYELLSDRNIIQFGDNTFARVLGLDTCACIYITSLYFLQTNLELQNRLELNDTRVLDVVSREGAFLYSVRQNIRVSINRLNITSSDAADAELRQQGTQILMDGVSLEFPSSIRI